MNLLERITYYLGGGLIVWFLNLPYCLKECGGCTWPDTWFWGVDYYRGSAYTILWLGIFQVSWPSYSDGCLRFAWNVD